MIGAAPAPRPRRRGLAAAVVIADNLIWGASYPATAIALRGMAAAWLTLVRLAIGAVLLMPWLRLQSPHGWTYRDAAWATVLGLLGFTLPVYLQIIGLRDSSPALAAIFVALEPLLTALIAAVALREAVPWKRRAALLLAFLGAWATAGFPRPGRPGHALADILLLAANLGFAAYNALGTTLSQRVGAPAATAATLLAGCAGMLPIWLLAGAPLPHQATVGAWAALAFLALPATAGAYLGWMWAVTRLPVAVAALSLYLQPVVGVLLAVALTGVRPAPSFYLGATAILGALAMGRHRAAPPA